MAACSRDSRIGNFDDASEREVCAISRRMTKGLKLDSGKLAYHLLDAEALAEQVAVLTYGGILYEPGNWRHVEEADDRYFDALQRHLRDARRGRSIDPESNLLTLAHAACCIHFLLAIELSHGEHGPLEDRLKAAVASAKELRDKRLAAAASAEEADFRAELAGSAKDLPSDPKEWRWRAFSRGKEVAAGYAGTKPKAKKAARAALKRRGLGRGKLVLTARHAAGRETADL